MTFSYDTEKKELKHSYGGQFYDGLNISHEETYDNSQVQHLIDVLVYAGLVKRITK